MESDPLLKELHRIREENARRHKFDAQSMARSFAQRQRKSGHRVVNLHRDVKVNALESGR